MSRVDSVHRPLRSGVQITSRDGGPRQTTPVSGGTLGALAKRGNQDVLVTCMHVMAGTTKSGGNEFLRDPSSTVQMFQGGDSLAHKVGTIVDWERVKTGPTNPMEIDAAICSLEATDSWGDDTLGAVHKLHDSSHGNRTIIGSIDPYPGMKVIMLGAVSGEISGEVFANVGTTAVPQRFAGSYFHNLFWIGMNSDVGQGDSGSPILHEVEDGVYRIVGINMGNIGEVIPGPPDAIGGPDPRRSLACRATSIERILNIRFGHRKPIANAGDDQGVLPNTVVTLDGSGSKVYDGDAKYQWEQVYAGVSTEPNPDFHRVTITNPTSRKATFTMPENEQTLLFKLTVTDSYKLTSTDYVAVNLNRPPVANAGPDQQVGRGVRVDLKGSAEDPDNQRLTHEWTKIYGPDVTLHDSKTLTPYFVAPNESAIFAWRLTVKDSLKAEHSDYVIVFVDYTPDTSWQDWIPVVPPQYRGSGANRERRYKRDGVYLLPPIDREGNPVSESARRFTPSSLRIAPLSLERIPPPRPARPAPSATRLVPSGAGSSAASSSARPAALIARRNINSALYTPAVADPFNPGVPKTQYEWRSDPEEEEWGPYERTGEYEGCGPNRKAEERHTSNLGNTETRLVSDPEAERWGSWSNTNDYRGCGPNRERKQKSTSHCGNTKFQWVAAPEAERWGSWSNTNDYRGCGPNRERKQKSTSHCGNTKFQWVAAPEAERWGSWSNTNDYRGCGPNRERKQKSTSHCGNTKFQWVAAPEPERWGSWSNTSDYRGCGPNRERKQKSTSHCGNTKFQWVAAPEPERWGSWSNTNDYRGCGPNRERKQKRTSHCGNTESRWVAAPEPGGGVRGLTRARRAARRHAFKRRNRRARRTAGIRSSNGCPIASPRPGATGRTRLSGASVRTTS